MRVCLVLSSELRYFLEESLLLSRTEMSKTGEDGNSMKKQTILTAVYLAVWILSLMVFWIFMDGSDAIAYSLIFLYTLLPLTTLGVSFLIGKNNFFGKGKWASPVFFGLMLMLAEYLTFSLSNMISISFARINVPSAELFFAGAVVSLLGLGIGYLIYRRKAIHLA